MASINETRASFFLMLKILLLFVLAVIVGLLCKLIGLPAGWLLGSLAVSSLFATKNWAHIKISRNLYLMAQALLGVALSNSFTPETLQLLTHNWFSVFVVVFAMIGIGLVNGWWLVRYRNMDPATAFLGCLPGGAGQMVAASDDLNADARIVAVMQYTRLLVMMLLISSAARVLLWFYPTHFHLTVANQGIYALFSLPLNEFFIQTTLSLLLAAAGVLIYKFVRMPAGALVFPALMSVGFSFFTHIALCCPPILLIAAYLVMGLQVGSRFDSRTWPQLASLSIPIAASLGILIVGSAFLAWWFMLALPTDPLTGLLAAAPGSLDTAAVASIDLNTNGTVVVAVHFLRLAMSMLLGPPIVELITLKFPQSPDLSGKSHP